MNTRKVVLLQSKEVTIFQYGPVWFQLLEEKSFYKTIACDSRRYNHSMASSD